MIKWDLFQQCNDGSVSADQCDLHHTNKTKDKYHIIIPTDTEKALDEIQHPFMIKISTN